MLQSILVPIHWVIGALALAGAFFFPFLYERMASLEKKVVEDQIQAIARKQGEAWTLKKKFVQFPPSPEGMRAGFKALNLPLDFGSQEFRYEAFLDQEGRLVVRAFTDPDKPITLFSLVGIHSLKIDAQGSAGPGKWEALTNKKRGLF